MAEETFDFEKALDNSPVDRLKEVMNTCRATDDRYSGVVLESFYNLPLPIHSETRHGAVCRDVRSHYSERLNSLYEDFKQHVRNTSSDRLEEVAGHCLDSQDTYSSVEVDKYLINHAEACYEARSELATRPNSDDRHYDEYRDRRDDLPSRLEGIGELTDALEGASMGRLDEILLSCALTGMQDSNADNEHFGVSDQQLCIAATAERLSRSR